MYVVVKSTDAEHGKLWARRWCLSLTSFYDQGAILRVSRRVRLTEWQRLLCIGGHNPDADINQAL
jgi:hypothetical protein